MKLGEIRVGKYSGKIRGEEVGVNIIKHIIYTYKILKQQKIFYKENLTKVIKITLIFNLIWINFNKILFNMN